MGAGTAWPRRPRDALVVDDQAIPYGGAAVPADAPWAEHGVEIVVGGSGRFRTPEALQAYFDAGVRKVVVAAPVKDGRAEHRHRGQRPPLRPRRHHIVTAASCTTNCLAPLVKVLHEGIGIERGSITTLHDVTNTQTIVDAPHKDLRRARAASMSLIPTTTGSATAIGLIFPPVAGQARRPGRARPAAERLTHRRGLRRRARDDGARRSTQLLAAAAAGPLDGILGYEERPLVSIDFKDDPRSGSSTPCRPWSPTARRSRCWRGTTTSGATPTG